MKPMGVSLRINMVKKEKQDLIIVKGARTHNLKNITVEIPRNKMVVFTGLSGSGKSSLAFDTIFAEGQRRYVESLSSYARQFLRQMQKPDVDEISGLSPAISIDQKSRSNNPRSTVATITEIYDYLRILYSRIGHPHCLVCGDEIKKLSNEEIKNFVLEKIDVKKKHLAGSTKKIPLPMYVEVFSPIVSGRKGEYYQLLYDLLGKGYSHVLVDGVRKSLRDRIELSKTKRHSIDVLVDSISLLDFKTDVKGAEERLSEDLEKALQESDGKVKIMFRDVAQESNKGYVPEEFFMSSKLSCPKDGYSYPEVEPRLFSFNSPYGACPECNGLGTRHFFGKEPCPKCNGARLREEALHVTIGGKNIVELTAMSIRNACDFVMGLKLTEREVNISKVVMREIESRLLFMINVGIEYLSLNRRAHTLSGGEAQRIRLASQLGSGLVGALYVLDEPTIGLHSRDNDRLVKTLLNLRDLGNTIIVVEHDEDTIFASDYIVDIGPGAGIHGGHVVVSDYLDELITAKKNDSGSVTLDYLRGDKVVEVPEERRTYPKGELQIRGGKIFNIKNMNVDIPLGRFVAVTGVSGSGKSSFVYEILHRNLQARFERKYRSAEIYNCKSFVGTEYLGRAILIDQSPIGRTPRSNPATYTGAWTFVRDLFAESAEARARGWKANRFSFNVKGGRCETCQGNGMIEVEMHFLPTVYVPCDVCKGKRFMKETLEVQYKKKNIYEVLKMTVEEALKFFEDIPALADRLKTLEEVGLGYLELGQSATTLSGGEAQRVKISSELYRPHLQKTIYLLDEPTIGLHYEDVKKLIEILQKLVNKGNTVLVIEHNMDIIKSCDYVIDIGPEGGEGGGQIVAKGTPEEVANSEKSYTGKYLKKALKQYKAYRK
ncbi:MAG: Excinuclease ABC, subunit A [Parcubacteria group bacterium GW2011_GWC2_40_10]|nr:MAG: Excinuclease ABC, subunit A [Parcubacteria group bacterium GW2011_GWC1_39_12]KKR19621.1 MAG: Excinuclease ABC, subunit A [Parcubacteria group bacterium GW2011_GWF1_39_37]KKR35775.1 MAG: Excinuclease ABC, subunit A [Parcubacteria group bacterium GW2011_GWC2_40_10]KKR52589.1 MAG: Excinuclease ABC, subunit A [Parcubacteria group bacterium GW2011_GWE1_40_20]KKR80679.1 MAG: Excinuclease ABC, subunit A [Parcubacteria group bacterium GW2011_GWD1_40_9]KKS36115.1 MAG: Excinuclease ABC, subunit 